MNISNQKPPLNNHYQINRIFNDYLFMGAEHQANTAGINFAFADYLELIDWIGRCIRNDKQGV
ncbi:hypothetical protein AYY19_13775 [Photobacterium aquimaris]|uniref:hypothetical protein n=1 Tax=Photobacterium aquimaris TaxID=512643 RepID=UPI0007F02B4D|nr:hypothetical protein [Photobacterium aquimaris]OBU17311.1 hypothetical protein AYY19_13775 [Photobacterium aquimaris]PSW01624.1 hypothetical protein CTM91_08175 [Photobacterium aquimaris]